MKTKQQIIAEMDKLEIEQGWLSQQKKVIADRQRMLQMQYLMLEYGISKGSTVRANGSDYRVDGIAMWWDRSRPWLKARKIRKDGTPAEKAQTLSDWQ